MVFKCPQCENDVDSDMIQRGTCSCPRCHTRLKVSDLLDIIVEAIALVDKNTILMSHIAKKLNITLSGGRIVSSEKFDCVGCGFAIVKPKMDSLGHPHCPYCDRLVGLG